MLFNRITDSLSALVLFVLQELTLTQKDINPPITVKTINNGELHQCELFYKCHSDKADNKGRNIAQTNMHNI
jgi:hypothetical protein